MQRSAIQIVKMRMGDLKTGDVVNKNPDDPRGWFIVRDLEHLPNGGLAVNAMNAKDSINGRPQDLVGVQIRYAIDIPDAPKVTAA